MKFFKEPAMPFWKKLTYRGIIPYLMPTLIIMALFLFPRPGHCANPDNRCAAPIVGKGFTFSVFAKNLPSVDNLAEADNGSIYATLEQKKGRGKVVRIAPNGASVVIVQGLSRPDGIRRGFGKLYIVEETKKGRVLEYDIKKKTLRVIARIGYLEGLAIISKHELVVSRDRKKGKLIRVTSDGNVTVIKKKLRRPEGIVAGKNGKIYIAETATGKVLEYGGGKIKTIIKHLDNPDQLAMTSDGTLLITEDADPGRLLSYHKGKLKTIARCLSSPQGILPLEEGIFVSEQGKGRVLKFTGR